MSRAYKTVDQQNTYDLAVQAFGSLNNLDKVLRQVPDINGLIPNGTDMTFADTSNNLAIRFDANNLRFATGNQSEVSPIYQVFDNTFDSTFN